MLISSLILLGVMLGGAIVFRIIFPKRGFITHYLTYALIFVGACAGLIVLIGLSALAGSSMFEQSSPQTGLASLAAMVAAFLIQKRVVKWGVKSVRGVDPFKPRTKQLAANWNLPTLPGKKSASGALDGLGKWESLSEKKKNSQQEQAQEADYETDPTPASESTSSTEAPPDLGDPTESNTVRGGRYRQKIRNVRSSVRETVANAGTGITIGNWHLDLGANRRTDD